MQQNNIFMEQTFNYLEKMPNTRIEHHFRKKLQISVNIRENLRLGK